MGIFDQMGKVIASNLNALLDWAEDDKKLVELNLEDMDSQLRRGREEMVATVGSEKLLRKKIEELTNEAARWEKRAELALAAQDEALAREALIRKQQLLADRDGTEKARAETRDAALRMKSELDRMEAKLKDFKLRRGTLGVQAQQARAGGGATGLGAGRGPSAFDQFRDLENKIEGRETEALAMGEVEDALGRGPKEAELEAKFRDLERGLTSPATASVDDELAALKKRIRVDPT